METDGAPSPSAGAFSRARKGNPLYFSGIFLASLPVFLYITKAEERRDAVRSGAFRFRLLVSADFLPEKKEKP